MDTRIDETRNSPSPARRERVGRRRLVEALGLEPENMPEDPQVRAALRALGDEVLGLHEEVAQLRKALRASAQLADHDTLCPIFNRRAFVRELKREIALAARFDTPLSLIYLDLDGFKAVNDSFGHAAGDAVLSRVADILVGNTRDTDIVARLGGDEFGVAMPHAALKDAEERAGWLASRIAKISVRDAGAQDGDRLRLGVSFGAASWTPELDPETLISRADAIMYARKSAKAAPDPALLKGI